MSAKHQQPIDMDRIRKLRAEGLSYAVIYQRTGHSYDTIKKHMYREKKKKEAEK